QSDNSYDYLSVEEKECLMFLEETIGSLDTEADSGVSTDETDYVEPSKLPGMWRKRDSSAQGKPGQAVLQPLVAKGLSWWGLLAWQAAKEHCPGLRHVASSGWWLRGLQAARCPVSICRAIHDCFSLSLSLSLSFCLDLENGAPLPPAGHKHAAEQRSSKNTSASSSSAVPVPAYRSLPRSINVANGASESQATVEDPVPGEKASQMAKEDRLDPANTRNQTKSPGTLIVQPADPSQDELVSHEWSHTSRSGAKGEAATEPKGCTAWGQADKATLEGGPQDHDAKRGPPTAPKPRKLPPNIVLKASKSSSVPLAPEASQRAKATPPPSATPQPCPASDSAAEKLNSGHLDPKDREKAHREALQKLGLSQPGSRPQPTAHPPAREMPSASPGEAEAGAGCGAAGRQMPFKSNTLERSGVGLSSYMASAKEQNLKSGSGSSSLGKMSFIERLAPSFLRSSRPRPVSLGGGKDFAALKECGQAEQQEKSSKRRSHPLHGFPRPPRSCVSVKITPKGSTDETRREALKKLGLLKE
ncbi:SARG protein, partial [Psilopogon haemacephalus]|nr:SARG protein [Psilopogon haemacephalus]